jgi:hypothetical protein
LLELGVEDMPVAVEDGDELVFDLREQVCPACERKTWTTQRRSTIRLLNPNICFDPTAVRERRGRLTT